MLSHPSSSKNAAPTPDDAAQHAYDTFEVSVDHHSPIQIAATDKHDESTF
jgi:hypothetical protein